MEPSVQSVDRWDSPGDPGQRGFVSPSFTAQHDEEACLTRVDDKGTERVITSGGDAETVLGKEPGGTLSEKNAGKGPGGTPSEKNAGKGPSRMPSENVGKGPGGVPSEKYAGKGPSGKPSENPGKGPSGTPSEKYAGKEPCGTPSEKNAGVVEGCGSIPDLNHPGLAAPVRELPKDSDNGKPAGADKDRGDTTLLRGAANGAEASGMLHSDAAPLAESNGGEEVVCVPVMDSEVEVADTVEVEVPVADILDVEVPLTESGIEAEAARVPQGVEVEMEVQVADMVEVEVPTVDSLEGVETLPMQASKSEPTMETVAMETRAAEDAPGVETADSEEVVEDTLNVQMADSEVVVETALAEGASNVERADSEAAVETTAPPEETSVSASDQLADIRAGKSSKSACIQWVELADDVKDSLSEPVSDAVCSETVCQEQSTGLAVMESAATPGGAVETTPAKESRSVETTPAKESCNVETTPAKESCNVETTPAKESRNVETTPAKESCNVETTPAKESCSVETTPAKESHNVETTPAAAVETTRVKESHSVETTPANESCNVETVPAAAVETTCVKESCSVETTPAKESRNVETTPAVESRSVETTPAKESFSVETTPATEGCNVETAPATERCKQPEEGAKDSKMKNFGGSSHHLQLCSPDAAALSAGRETALMTTKPRTCNEGKATDACLAPNPRTSNTEDDETSPAGQAVTPSIAKVQSSAGDVTSEVWPSPRDASCWLTPDAEGADRRAVKETQEGGSGTPEKVAHQKRGEAGGVADSVTCGAEVGSWGAEPAEVKKTGIVGNDVSRWGSPQKAFGVWEKEIGEKGDGTAERVPTSAGARVKGDGSGVDVSKTRTKGDGDGVGASETKTKGAGDGVGTSETRTLKESSDVGASKAQTRNNSDGVGASKTQTKNDGDGGGASKTQTQNDRSDVGASKTNKTKGDGVVGGVSKTKAKSGDGDVGVSKTKTRSGDDDAGASKTKESSKEGDEGAADRPGHVDNRLGVADESGFGSVQDEDVPAQMAGKADGKKQDVAAASTIPHSDGKSSAAEKDAKEEARPKLSHTGREDGSSSQVGAGDGRRNSAFKRSSSHERFGNIFDKFSQGGGLAKAVNATACKRDGGNGGAREEQVSNDSNLSKGSPAEPKPHCPGQAEDLKRKGGGEEQEEQSSGSSYAEEQEADQQEVGRGKIGDSSRTVDTKRSERDPESRTTGHQGNVKRGECSKSKATLTVDSQSRGKNASVHKKDGAQEVKVDGNKKHSEGVQKSSDGDDKLNKNGEEADEGEDDNDEGKEVRAEKEPDEKSLADSPAQKGVKSAPTSKTSGADKNSNTYDKEVDNEDSDEDNVVSTDKKPEVSLSAQSKLAPGQSKGDASSDRDADSVDFNQATQANFSDESSSESNSDDEEETVVKHNSVDHDFIFTDGKGEEEEGEEREDGAEEEDNASDEKRSVHSEAADKDPGTPQFQFSRLKTCKTYSRKSELALANPDNLDVSESEESDDSVGQRASPVARAPERSLRTRENGDMKEGAAIPASRSLWKVEETRVVQDPSKSKPSIVSRITKALTSVPRNLGGAVPAASASWDVSKARPMSRVSCGLQKVKIPPQTLRVRSDPLPPDPRAKPKGRQRTPRKEGGGGIGSGDGGVVGVGIKVDVFECNICGKEFNALNRYKRHERSHSSGKRFCCDVCGKLFESQDKLDIHRQVHLQSSSGTFTCPHCGEICKKWRPFLYHLSKHQADGGKKYNCQLCGHTLFAADRLRRHTKHHKQGLNFCCFTCGKLFLTQERLDTHTAVHSSSRPTKPTLPTPTPQRTAHKRSSTSPSDGKQPLPKCARAARQEGGGKDGRGVVRKSPAQISDSESSLSSASTSADEGSKSGASTPARDHHPAPETLAAAVDVGEVRSSSRKRSHSRKRCPCCPSSPTSLHTLSPAHHAKAKSPGGDRAERPVRPREVGVGHKSASPRASGRKKEAPAEVGEGEVKKMGAVQYSVCLRECSVKLERSPELSAPLKRSPTERSSSSTVSLEPPLKTESSASASHLRTTTTTTPEKMDPSASEGKHTPRTEHPSSPSSENTPKKPASEKSRKSASEKLKRPATDPYEGRKVKIYRTASEKLLPKNLALESASKERARRASKEKKERAAKAERPSEHRDTEERQAGASGDSQGSPKPYPCHICGKNLGSDKALKYHISDHVNAASPRQQAGTESVAHSLVYAKDLAPDKQGGYACNRCGYRTKSLADLWKHAKMHVEKGFQCKECCAAFAKPETLQHHMKAHNKGKA